MKITLTSTPEVDPEPPPARLWQGQTEDGQPIVAWITLGAMAEGAPVDERTHRALAQRIQSTATVEIPDVITRCRECGCTEESACAIGCDWFEEPDPSTGEGLCTACARRKIDAR